MRLALAAALGLALFAGGAAAGDEPAPKTDREKLSYGMGVSMARNLQRQGAEVDADLMARGLKDALSGQKVLLSDEEVRAALSQFQAEQKKKQQARRQPPAEEAKKQGEAFLAENAKKEGVVTLPSGLQYKVLRAGEGKTPKDGDRVVCHYRGTFVDGTEFDSSYKRGKPATFDLARMIPGFREALKLMPAGSKWQLFIPAKLAYGERGMRGKKRKPGFIGPNATLIYETELLDVQPGPGSQKTAAAHVTITQ
jgi:FKBP-type peptidyl-prolyl cis-trans isomerase